jgi:uncharacterized protein YcbX
MTGSARTITLASAPLRVISPIARCAATHFNPATAKHDLDIVAVLGCAFGDFSMGVYTEAMAGREIAVVDELFELQGNYRRLTQFNLRVSTGDRSLLRHPLD